MRSPRPLLLALALLLPTLPAASEDGKKKPKPTPLERGIAGIQQGADTVRLQAAHDLGLLGEEAVEPLRALMKSRDPLTRECVLFAFSFMRTPADYLPEFKSGLKDTEGAVRAVALQQCHQLAPEDPIVAAAVGTAHQDKSPRVRIWSVSAAEERLRGRDQSDGWQESLSRVESLLTDKEGSVRTAAAEVWLWFCPGDTAGPAILAMASSDKDPGARATALRGLGKFPPAETLPILVAALSGGTERTRAAAAVALGEVINPATLPPDLAPKLQAALTTLLGRKTAEDRSSALRVLKAFPEDPGGHLPAVERLGSDGDPLVKNLAGEILERWKR